MPRNTIARAPYVIRCGNPGDGWRIVGPFPTFEAANRSPWSKILGAELICLTMTDDARTRSRLLRSIDERPCCANCGSQDLQSCEWVTTRPDRSLEWAEEGPNDAHHCRNCDPNGENCDGVEITYDQEEGRRFREAWEKIPRDADGIPLHLPESDPLTID